MDEESSAVEPLAGEGELETPEVESAPTEETAPTETDASEKTEIPQEPEEEKTVPLSALQREREARKQAEEQTAIFRKITEKGRDIPSASSPGPAGFDEETATSLEKWYQQKKLEDFQADQARKVADFTAKHAEELKDPLLDALVIKVIKDANAINRIIDQEEALQIAKSTLEARVKTAESTARGSGFEEGQQTALKKTKGSAIGDGVKAPAVDFNAMTAEEYATYFGIQKVDI